MNIFKRPAREPEPTVEQLAALYRAVARQTAMERLTASPPHLVRTSEILDDYMTAVGAA